MSSLETSARSRTYKYYLLFLLTIILLCNYLDRMALGIIVEDLKADLGLSDTQIGFLTGIAFAVFYSLMGLPIARMADRGDRIAVISVATLLWSVMVALCGVAANYVQLLLVRIGVAVGEAGCIPPAASLIAEHFERAERPRANAIYALGGALSILIGGFGAGWLTEMYGWRVTFLVLAVPGFILAPLAWFTLVEPRRRAFVRGAPPVEHADIPIGRALSLLNKNTTFKYLLACQSLYFLLGYGFLQWQPAFFMRSHGLDAAEVGAWLGMCSGVGALIGTLLGGEWATRFAANNERLQLKICAVTMVVAGVAQTMVFVAPTAAGAFVATGIATGCLYATGAPMSSTLQSIVAPRMRAVTVAIWYLVANLVGMGFGPLLAGFASDMLRPTFGVESLRITLVSFAPGFAIGGLVLLLASRSVKRDVTSAEIMQEQETAS